MEAVRRGFEQVRFEVRRAGITVEREWLDGVEVVVRNAQVGAWWYQAMRNESVCWTGFRVAVGLLLHQDIRAAKRAYHVRMELPACSKVRRPFVGLLRPLVQICLESRI